MRHNLITFPTWAGVEALGEESLDSPATRITEDVRRTGQQLDLFSIVSAIRGVKTKKISNFDVITGSSLSWNISDGIWSVNNGKEYYTILPKDDGYLPYHIWKEDGAGWNDWSCEPIFSRTLGMEMAFGVADTKIKKNKLNDRSASWRFSGEQPTEAQVNYARKLGIEITSGLTKAGLSDKIDQVVFANIIKNLRAKNKI